MSSSASIWKKPLSGFTTTMGPLLQNPFKLSKNLLRRRGAPVLWWGQRTNRCPTATPYIPTLGGVS